MAGYIVRRLLQAIPVLLGTTFLIYYMVFAMPGDPIVALFGDKTPPPQVLEQLRERYHQPHKRFAPELMRWLSVQSWPGNVRELESIVHREFVLAEGDTVVLRAVLGGIGERRASVVDRRRASATAAVGLKEYKARAVAELERNYLLRLISECGGNVSQAARRVGKERRALGKLLKKYGIERDLHGQRD